MLKKSISLLILCTQFAPLNDVKAQPQNDQLGAWYMYFFNTNFNDSPWGVQGDIQHRNWNIAGDLEQLLLRGGLTYSPKMRRSNSLWVMEILRRVTLDRIILPLPKAGFIKKRYFRSNLKPVLYQSPIPLRAAVC